MFSLTKKVLEEFDNQHDFERMCSDILNALKYRDVALVAPRGGSDGGKDITFSFGNEQKGLACVTLRKDIDKKFREDFSQRKSGEYDKYILFCNVYLTATQKMKYAQYCSDKLHAEFVPQDIEALRSLLDSSLKDVRKTHLEKYHTNLSPPSYQFAVSADLGLDPIDEHEYPDEPYIWRRAMLRYRFLIRSSNFGWVEDGIIGIVFYSGDRLYTTESSLPDWISNTVQFRKQSAHHRILHHSKPLRMINPSTPIRTEWLGAHLSIDHGPWQAGIYILAKNLPPVWHQFSIVKGKPTLTPQPGQGVQVRDFALSNVDNPIVSVGNQSLI